MTALSKLKWGGGGVGHMWGMAFRAEGTPLCFRNREERERIGGGETGWSEVVRTSCLETSLLPMKSWARPCTRRGKEGGKGELGVEEVWSGVRRGDLRESGGGRRSS